MGAFALPRVLLMIHELRLVWSVEFQPIGTQISPGNITELRNITHKSVKIQNSFLMEHNTSGWWFQPL